MKTHFNNIFLGTFVGAITPLVSFFLIVRFVYPFEFVDKSLQSLWMHVIAPQVLSLGAIPNLGLFFLFIYANKLRSARGVLLATIGYAILVFILKLA